MARCRGARHHRNAAGFSFLWTLLLVAFLGLGLTIGVEIDSTMVQREREQELLSIGRQFRAAIERYYQAQLPAGQREFPATLDELLHDNRAPGVTRHLRKVFVDPMTGKPEWGLVLIGGRIVGVHSLSDRAPVKQDNFELDELSFRHARKISGWVFAYSGKPREPGTPTPPSQTRGPASPGR